MTQITARMPDDLVAPLDAAAAQLRRSRAEAMRQALESYLDDSDDLAVAVERLRGPFDTVLDRDEVKRDLRRSD